MVTHIGNARIEIIGKSPIICIFIPKPIDAFSKEKFKVIKRNNYPIMDDLL